MGKFIHDIASLALNERYEDENAAAFQRNFEMHSSVLHFVKYLHAGDEDGREGSERKHIRSKRSGSARARRKWVTYFIREVNLGRLPQT